MDLSHPSGENYANPRTCLFHMLFKAAALALTFSVIRLEPDYVLVIGVCSTLGVANIVGFTKCQKDAKKEIQAFATKTLTSCFSSTVQNNRHLV